MQTITHKCPNCDAPLLFIPKTQTFHCDYCLLDFTQEQIIEYEKKQKESSIGNLEKFQEDDIDNEHKIDENTVINDQDVTLGITEKPPSHVYSCPNCGAQIIVDETTIISTCYYCHNPVVLEGRISGKYFPDYLIPFKISRETAIDMFFKNMKKKKLLPRNFVSDKQLENMSGIYFPFWNLDYDADVTVNAQGEKVSSYRSGNYEYTTTKVYSAVRSGAFHSNYLNNALTTDKFLKFINNVHPYHLLKEDIVPFSSAYFAGFMAEKRDIEFETIENNVNNTIGQSISDYVANDLHIRYSNVKIKNVKKEKEQRELSYIYLPIWLITYHKESKNNKKIYYFAINGQTGTISGQYPVSIVKLILLFFAIGIPIFALVMLFFV